MDWSSFIPNLLSTLVGAFAGFASALWLDRNQRRRAQRQEAKTEQRQRDSRQADFLRNALWSVEENLRLFQSIY